MKRLLVLCLFMLAVPAFGNVTPTAPTIDDPDAEVAAGVNPVLFWTAYTAAGDVDLIGANAVQLDYQVQVGAKVSDCNTDLDTAANVDFEIKNGTGAVPDCQADNTCYGAGMAALVCTDGNGETKTCDYPGTFIDGAGLDGDTSLDEGVTYCARVRVATPIAAASCDGTDSTSGDLCWSAWSTEVEFVTVDYSDTANRFASVNGTGSDPCTSGDPCPLDVALDAATLDAGDWVSIAAGTYYLDDSNSGDGDCSSAANSCVIDHNPFTAGVKIVGAGIGSTILRAGTAPVSPLIRFQDAESLHIEGIEFSGWTGNNGCTIGTNPTDMTAVDVSQGDPANNTFIDVKFSDCAGIYTGQSQTPGAGSHESLFWDCTWDNTPGDWNPPTTPADFSNGEFDPGTVGIKDEGATNLAIVGGTFIVNDDHLQPDSAVDVLIESTSMTYGFGHSSRPRGPCRDWTIRRLTIGNADIEGLQWDAGIDSSGISTRPYNASGIRNIVIENSTANEFEFSDNAGDADGEADGIGLMVFVNNIVDNDGSHGCCTIRHLNTIGDYYDSGNSPQCPQGLCAAGSASGTRCYDNDNCPSSTCDGPATETCDIYDAAADRIYIDYNIWRRSDLAILKFMVWNGAGGNDPANGSGTGAYVVDHATNDDYDDWLALAHGPDANSPTTAGGVDGVVSPDPELTNWETEKIDAGAIDATPSSTSSPVVDAGHPDYSVPSVDAVGGTVDIGAVELTQAAPGGAGGWSWGWAWGW